MQIVYKWRTFNTIVSLRRSGPPTKIILRATILQNGKFLWSKYDAYLNSTLLTFSHSQAWLTSFPTRSTACPVPLQHVDSHVVRNGLQNPPTPIPFLLCMSISKREYVKENSSGCILFYNMCLCWNYIVTPQHTSFLPICLFLASPFPFKRCLLRFFFTFFFYLHPAELFFHFLPAIPCFSFLDQSVLFLLFYRLLFYLAFDFPFPLCFLSVKSCSMI